MNFFRSQCGEDRWLSSNWPTLRLPERGVFVEVGAADGVTFSNTYWLEMAKGWKGLLIEADWRHSTSHRPGSAWERIAIGDPGERSFGLEQDPFLSGMLRESASRMVVECKPLSDVLRLRGIEHVDLLSIDTEGTELEVWKTLDLATWRPQVAIIELDTWGLANVAGEVIQAVAEDGYELVHRTKYNGIFVDAIRS